MPSADWGVTSKSHSQALDLLTLLLRVTYLSLSNFDRARDRKRQNDDSKAGKTSEQIAVAQPTENSTEDGCQETCKRDFFHGGRSFLATPCYGRAQERAG